MRCRLDEFSLHPWILRPRGLFSNLEFSDRSIVAGDWFAIHWRRYPTFSFSWRSARVSPPRRMSISGRLGERTRVTLVTLIRIESGSGGTGSVVEQDQGSPRGSIDDLVSDACQRD